MKIHTIMSSVKTIQVRFLSILAFLLILSISQSSQNFVEFNFAEECRLASEEKFNFVYDFAKPIYVINKAEKWNSSKYIHVCKLLVNATEAASGRSKSLFMIRLNTIGCSSKSQTKIGIVDHSPLPMENSSIQSATRTHDQTILNTTSICERFEKVNFFLFESSCFELRFFYDVPIDSTDKSTSSNSVRVSSLNDSVLTTTSISSKPFEEVESFVITAFNYPDKSKQKLNSSVSYAKRVLLCMKQ